MNTNDNTERLLSRAAIFHLSATGLAYPGAALKAQLLDTLARMAPRGTGIAPALDRLTPAWAAVDEDTLIEDYSRLFIGSDAVVLHETAYSNTGRSAELADISGFYLAFGFDLREDQREVPDHLSVELEFYSLLLLKQAYALDQGWQDKFDIARDAAKAFLADHLGRWVDAVRERATARQAAPVYRILFEIVADVVQRECQALAVRPAPLMCSGPDFMQAASFVCPMEQQASAATRAGASASTDEPIGADRVHVPRRTV